jgi:hypothetical protein
MNPLIDRALQFLRVNHDVPAEPEFHLPNGIRYRVDKYLMTEEEIIVLASSEGFVKGER